jgi:hypothetical protein
VPAVSRNRPRSILFSDVLVSGEKRPAHRDSSARQRNRGARLAGGLEIDDVCRRFSDEVIDAAPPRFECSAAPLDARKPVIDGGDAADGAARVVEDALVEISRASRGRRLHPFDEQIGQLLFRHLLLPPVTP